MNERPGPRDGSDAATAALELVHLREQAREAHTTLARLQQELHLAQSRLAENRAAELIEANQHLVLAALQAQSHAETATRALNEVSRSAELDPLTALPNRVLLLDRFARAISQAERRGDYLALLFLDLNNFKQINDTLGHSVGDEVLKLAARRLAASVRDMDTVSRHGGDEFLVLLTEVSQISDAFFVAHKMIAALGAPCRVRDHALRLTASVGISIYPDDGTGIDTLVDRADAAMYRAKRHGHGSFVFRDPEPPDDRSLEPPPPVSLQRPLTRHELARVEHEDRETLLHEANGELVCVALGAQALQADAEQALGLQKKLLALAAHELRNPLTPIRLAAAMLGTVSPGEVPRLQAVIEKQVATMARLVDDLIDVSRAGTGTLRLRRGRVDLAGILDEAVEACRPAMSLRRQRLSVRLPPRPLALHADPTRLAQVFCNLLDNACKYTQEGGEIALSVRTAGDAVDIEVSDNGIGIDADTLPNIFGAFVQDARATRFDDSGLGLGLTVVRELVEAHGGRIVATSQGTGLGSRFVVTLPLPGRSAAPDGDGRPEAPARGIHD